MPHLTAQHRTSLETGRRSRILRGCRAVVLATFVTMATVPHAFAVNTWNPTLLVNTQPYQVIDDSSAQDLTLKFGSSLNKNITYQRTLGRFKFDAGVYVQGSLGVTGTMSGNALYVQRAFSGAGLTSCSNGSNDKLLWNSATQQFSCGSDQGGGGGGISQADGDARFVNQSGDTMTGTLRISNTGGLNASGAVLTNGNITINSDNGAADASLTFGNATLSQTLQYSHANQRFEFSKDVRVTGGITVTGALSGNTLTVSGTSGTPFKIDDSVIFDASNTRFGIGTVTPETTLEVAGTMSGRLIRAQDQLESSGSLVLGGAMKLKPSANQTISAAGNSVLANASLVRLDPSGNYTLTSTPTIADGVVGQVVIITADNAETNKVILQDEDTLANTNLELGSTAREITAKKALTLIFDGTDWVEQAYTTESVDVQTFTIAGANTWTKPTGAKAVYVICVGGGGGGGGGTGGAAGTARIGGGGGGGGARAERWLSASDLGATETATVGAGGNAGNGGVSGGAAATNGTAGGNSTFGAYLTCYGGGYGKGAVAATASAGGGGGGSSGAGSNGASATNIGGSPAVTAGANGIAGQGGGGNIGAANGQAEYGGGGGNGSSAVPAAAGAGGGSLYGAGGGGGGGGLTTANATATSGAGGRVGLYSSGGGGAGGLSSATCTAGTAGTAGNSTRNGSGGGGGGSDTDSTGCAGGAGGALGGGGGGGGGGTTTGGAGGAGGRGEIRVYTFY